MKINIFFIACLSALTTRAQQTIYSANFENNKMDSCWQIVTGNWHIDDVQKMRIAPAEGGHQYVLCADNNGYIGNNIIRLMVGLPDSFELRKIKISFYYYILADTQGTKIEGEFYQNEIKDGLRGKPWVSYLPSRKGRWNVFQKTLTIPAKANSLRIVFYGLAPSGKKGRVVCFDNISIELIKKKL